LPVDEPMICGPIANVHGSPDPASGCAQPSLRE
jgi:hypothetical protein